ncbi:MAG: type II toxin-antitoxin system mRNA interferase toxin, RelE/StbE family [Minisyncoccia bacterium]
MKIEYSHSFKKDYKKLTSKLRSKFDERLILFQEHQFSPLLNNHYIHYPYDGCRSINISGDIRALYEIINDSEVFFIHIGSHSELYK